MKGKELNGEIDMIKYDLMCAGQNFSEDFCKCEPITTEIDGVAQDFASAFDTFTTLGTVLLMFWLVFVLGVVYKLIITKGRREGRV